MEFGLGLSKLLIFPLYVSSILVILLTIFYRIEIGIFFLIFFLPHQNILDYLNSLPFGKDINDFLFIALIIKWVLNKRNEDESFFIKTPLNLPIFILLIWTFIEIWWGASYFGDSISISTSNERLMLWKNWIRIPLLYLIVVNNVKNPNHMKVIVLLMIMSILLLDRSFYNIARHRDLSHYDDNRRFGGISNLGGNELAVFLAAYTIFLVSIFLHIPNFWLKLFLFLPIGASYFCIAFLFSRSGYAATVVGWVVLGFMKDKKMIILFILLVLSWQTLLPVAVKERIEMTKTEEGYDTTSQQRLAMWDLAQNIVFSSPIFGAGFGASQFMNITVEGIKDQTWHSFHNAYLQQAVETGIVGLAIYLWIFVIMIIIGWRLSKIANDWFPKALGLGFLACVLACMAGNFAGSYWNYFNVIGYMYVIAAMVVRYKIDMSNEIR